MTAPFQKYIQFADTLPKAALHPAALAAAEMRREESWCVALSGGADSLAVLALVWAHWPEKRAGLVALHFNHRLRGADADADEAFCREVCAALGIAFRAGAWSDPPAAASEAEAREARHRFFAEEMKRAGARVLWTGHHLDDVVETQLMRLARGASAAGLAAPRPMRRAPDGRVFIRPLLNLRKTRIVAALSAVGLSWREDASNTTDIYLRNRLRRDVMPAWVAACDNDAYAGAALSREWLEEDDDALEAWLAEVMPPLTDEGDCDLSPLADKPRALWRRALRRWAPARDLSRQAFTELLNACKRGEGRVNLNCGWAVVERHRLRWEQPRNDVSANFAARLSIEEAVCLPDGAKMEARTTHFDAELKTRIFSGQVDSSCEVFLGDFYSEFTVRAWQAGDRFRPLGAPGTAKLQDLFVNRKIAVERRHLLPIVCAPDGRIIWVPGFPPAEDSKVTADSVTGVQLTYLSGTSTLAH